MNPNVLILSACSKDKQTSRVLPLRCVRRVGYSADGGAGRRAAAPGAPQRRFGRSPRGRIRRPSR